MKFGIFVLLVAFAAYGNCASLVGLGADVLGHAVPVKCTVDCESAGPSVGPVVPSPLLHYLSGAGPLAPMAPPAAPAADDADVEAPAAAALPGLYGPWNHGYLGYPYLGLNGLHGLYGLHGLHGLHGLYGLHGHGFYATGPVDVNADGSTYTGPEDDHSPIAGGHVYSALEGAAKWHGLYGAPAHFPVLGGHYGHYPYGYWGYHGVPAGKVPEGEEFNGPILPYGHLTNWHGYPWSAHHPLAYGLHHGALDGLGLKPEDCAEGLLPHLVFDKSAKPVESEAVPVADA